ncbi:putative superfamily III holin-X [Stackebrandtia albiflava]|uniref:Putative superfamily III holin-X n=1 Tax=Stackebrandtia albiflava TaxID=406432 RepID=A0A562V557_9ACTN|nr:phage holin family protein [Stackebrandtia albiflava]TWJ13009.1 putative superfamily III holin-X [Stackebrandtia albiflava]
MTTYREAPTTTRPPGADHSETSIGRLIGDISDDVSQLFRQEVELAKAEVREEAGKAGKAAGMLGTAGFAGYMVAILLTGAVVLALSYVMPAIWAVLIVAVLWGVVGLIAYLSGRKRLRDVSPVPRQTVETLKEDARWFRNPTGSGATSSRRDPG